METCREFEIAIDREVAEGLPAEEREQLLDHLDRCERCSELFDLVTALKGEPVVDEPSEHELARIRRRLLADLPDSGSRGAAAPGGRAGRTRRTLRVALAAGIGAALLGGGVLLGRLGAPAPGAVAVDLGGASALSPSELRRAGYRFTRAAVEERGAERLRLAFDVSRSVEVEVDRNDPLVTEVLVQSLASPAELGSRLKAVETAADRIDPRVRRALIDVMRRDESVGVRLAAQETLLDRADSPNDQELLDSQLAVLEHEDSVQMRLAAIDFLTGQKVDAARLTRAIEAGEPQGERALFVRAGSYLDARDATTAAPAATRNPSLP